MTRLSRDELWQQHYDDFCMNECGGGEPSGRMHDEASRYADEMVEEEVAEAETEQWTEVCGDPLLNKRRAA